MDHKTKLGCLLLKHHLYSTNIPRNILPPLYSLNILTSHQPIPLRTYCNNRSKLSIRFSHNPYGRKFHTSSQWLAEPNKPSSKIEETTEAIKERAKEATEKKAEESSTVPVAKKEAAIVKKTLKERIMDEIRHYYHGFRLLFIDIRVSSMLVWKVLKGGTLTRREYNLVSNLNTFSILFIQYLKIRFIFHWQL
jgi:hypothetical protein